MAYGRRYKAKLHVLEEDDLASILTPAPPCKVPGLGTKGREEKREERGALFSSFFLFFCGSRRLRTLSALSASSSRALLSNQPTASMRHRSISPSSRQGLGG